MDNILVSIICNTYNHEAYIRDALDSFLIQKTNFQFEILIHDDASTDKTADIIKEYEKKYPEIVKPIYQKENQYSQGIECMVVWQYPRVSGKYIAICEGDDYWTDPFKLQKQVDVLEENTNIDICAHTADIINCSTKKRIRKIAPLHKNSIIPVERVIAGGGGFVATNSLMYRASLIKGMPEFVRRYHYDYAIQIYGSLRGGMLYLKDDMSAYRYMVPGSWSARTKKDSVKKEYYDRKFNDLYELIDKETGGRYSRYLSFNRYVEKNDSKEILSLKYRDVFKRLPFRRKYEIIILAYFPKILALKRRLINSRNE